MSQEDLGGAIGVDRRTIQSYERDEIGLRAIRRSQLAEALGISEIELQYGDVGFYRRAFTALAEIFDEVRGTEREGAVTRRLQELFRSEAGRGRGEGRSDIA